MKGIIWLASGLMLSLLLVSGVSVGSQLAESGNLFAIGDLKIIEQLPRQGLEKIDRGLSSQFTFLNNSAAVISTRSVVFDWFSPVTNWFGGLWQRFIGAWKNFLGLNPKEPEITSALREQIRQELLAELKNQGLFINSNSSTSSDSLGTKYGIMVTPSTGSITRDELLKKSLSQMFADQVNLRFDQTGMSGVVTPIFRDGRKGGDYIFVLTPLR